MPSVLAKTMPSSDHDTPDGSSVEHSDTGAPPVTGTCCSVCSNDDQKAIDFPSGENTGAVAPRSSVPLIGVASNESSARRYTADGGDAE